MFITLFVLFAVVSFNVLCDFIAHCWSMEIFEEVEEQSWSTLLNDHKLMCESIRSEYLALRKREHDEWSQLMTFAYADFKADTVRVLKNGSKLLIEKDAILGKVARFLSKAEYTKMFPTDTFVLDITDVLTGHTVRKPVEVEMPKYDESAFHERVLNYRSRGMILKHSTR